jgi:hypothetical protein
MRIPRAPRSCGECGNKILQRKQFNGDRLHWDGEIYAVVTQLELWHCSTCENVIPRKSEFESLDLAIEVSKKLLTKTALQNIKHVTKWRNKQIAQSLRISETYFSQLLNEHKIAEQRLYTQIMRIGASDHPELLLEDPDPVVFLKSVNPKHG